MAPGQHSLHSTHSPSSGQSTTLSMRSSASCRRGATVDSLSGQATTKSEHCAESTREASGVANACAVCLEDMEQQLAAMPCGHVFHEACAVRALQSRRACPVCRRTSSLRKLVRLYFSYHAVADRRDVPAAQASATESDEILAQLSDKLAAMRVELRRLRSTQRMAASRSFRVETDLVRLQQQRERAEGESIATRRELETVQQQLKTWKRIASKSYAQSSAAMREKAAMEARAQFVCDQILEKLQRQSAQGQQSFCCNCARQLGAVRQIAHDFCEALNADVDAGRARRACCCPQHRQRHHTGGQEVGLRTRSRAPSRAPRR